MTDRELMQQALEALEFFRDTAICAADTDTASEAIAALRERLAQPETEAEIYKRLYELRGKALDRPCSRCGYQPKRIYPMAQPEQSRAEKMRDAGYTRRPTLREIASEDERPEQKPGAVPQFRVQGCSDWYDGYPDYSDGTNAYETRTLYTSPQPTQQEPLAWVTFNAYGEEDDIWYENPEGKLLEGWTYRPLYTTPPRREWVGLTDEEIRKLCDENFIAFGAYAVDFISAIEAKLKEKNA